MLRWCLCLALSAADNRSCFWSAAARFERFWSLADYELFTSRVDLGGPLLRTEEDLGFRHLSFLVLASLERADYAERMERVWMHKAANRIYLVDALIPSIPESYQVVMNDGQQGSKDPVAMSRLMIWMNQVKHMYSSAALPPDLRWLVILGDDVYINMARMFYFLAGHGSKDAHPVIFAHVLSHTEVYDFDMPCMESAVVLSRRALELLSEHASCKTCPYTGSNGISLAYCSLYTAVPLVHVPHFHCGVPEVPSHWIVSGGLSQHEEMRPAALDADFPNLRCELPSELSVETLTERIRFCKAGMAARDGHGAAESVTRHWEFLADGAELDEITWRKAEAANWLVELNLEEMLRSQAQASKLGGPWQFFAEWYFIAQRGTWLHRAVVERFLQDLRYLPPLPVLAFASIPEGCWLLSGTAARRLPGLGEISTALLESLGVQVLATPLFSSLELLPRSLVGAVSAGAATGIWSVADLDEETYEDLEQKSEDRRFYTRLVQENFEELSADDCEDQSLREAQVWQRFLHDDDEHIKVVRGFQSGRREFRTLHAMYRSEVSESIPLRGVLQDTVLVARKCD